MQGVKLPLMAACQTLLDIPGRVSGAQVTFRNSKSGRMVVFLDARMHTVEIARGQELLKVSWKTSAQHAKHMTSGTDATYPVCILLSTEDRDFEYFRYYEGDLFRGSNSTLYHIQGLVLTEAGKLVYLLAKSRSKVKRFVSQESLEQGYSKIHPSGARFALMELA